MSPGFSFLRLALLLAAARLLSGLPMCEASATPRLVLQLLSRNQVVALFPRTRDHADDVCDEVITAGSAVKGMGFNSLIALRKTSATHVRFGSFAT
jgi:hypothetical protein